MMRKILLFTLISVFCVIAGAQSFTGTMTVGSYTQKDTEVRLHKNKSGEIVLTMYNVKFAYLMPVRLNITMSPLTLKDGKLRGDGIIPMSKGKSYEKYKVRNFNGTVNSSQISYSCMMGEKKLVFTGKRKK